MGPTASGKTALAEAVADRYGAQLINADAFQSYRLLDIGTAKPDDRLRYALLDFLDPREPYGLGAFIVGALPYLEQAAGRSRPVVVVGGTGLYIRGLFEEYADALSRPDPEIRAKLEQEQVDLGSDALKERLMNLDPELARRVDVANPLRVRRALEKLASAPSHRFALPPFRKIKVGLQPTKEVLSARIEERTEKMLAEGWISEVKRLLESGIPLDAPGMRAIGYREIASRLIEGTPLEGINEELSAKTRQYAKRQATWMRSEPGLTFLASQEMTGQLEEVERLLCK